MFTQLSNADVTSLNFEDESGMTPIFYAIDDIKNKPGLIPYLWKQGADLNWANSEGITPLFYAINKNMPEAFKPLVDAEANPNLENEFGITPILCALQHNPELIPDLVAVGANPNYINKYNETALTWATRLKKPNLIFTLALEKATLFGNAIAHSSTPSTTPLFDLAGVKAANTNLNLNLKDEPTIITLLCDTP